MNIEKLKLYTKKISQFGDTYLKNQTNRAIAIVVPNKAHPEDQAAITALFTAAPDLFKSVNDLSTALCGCPRQNATTKRALAKASAAIAKAKGGSKADPKPDEADITKALMDALERIETAARRRENTAGDACALFAAQTELRDAAKQASAAIALAKGTP